jgi:hypothetical protein
VKFCADSRILLARTLAMDLLVLLWTVGGVVLGLIVHTQILRLQGLAPSIRDTGRTFNAWIGDFSASVPGQALPIIGGARSDYLNQLIGTLRGRRNASSSRSCG